MSRTLVDSGITYLKKIPDSWNVFRIKDGFCCSKELVGDLWGSTQLLSLTTSGIKEKDIDNPNGKLPESFETYQYVKKNNIVMCLFDLDCSAVFSGISKYDGMISPAYRVLECKKNMIEPRYAGYYFNYISYDRKYMHYSKNIRFTLSFEEFSSLPMLYPSIEEQIKISNYLDDKCCKIDKTIEDNNKVIDLLEEYKNSIIKKVITQGLNNSNTKKTKFSWLPRINYNWDVVYLDTLASKDKYSMVDGPFGSDMKNEEYVDEGVPIVQLTNIKPYNHYIDELKFITEEKHQQLIRHTALKGDIVIAKMMPAGRACILSNDYPEYVVAADAIRFHPGDNVNKKFILYALNSYCIDECELSSKGTTRVRISLSLARRLHIAMPKTLDEQNEIVNYLNKVCDEINKVIDYRKSIIKKLDEYKKSLIYEVVTGKKEV